MDNLGILVIPIGFMVAAAIGYLSVKRHWKIADIL